MATRVEPADERRGRLPNECAFGSRAAQARPKRPHQPPKRKDCQLSTNTTSHRGVRPGSRAPALELPLVGGGTFRLAGATPALFTMLVFNRGLHCPVCRAQLSELDRRFDELAEKGIEVVSISGENEQRATQIRDDWKVRKVPLAYGLSEAQMREWGLFVSHGINDHEPPVFNEPALFLISPDGTVYYEAILSMPVGRPRLDELLSGIDYWITNHYPARGGE